MGLDVFSYQDPSPIGHRFYKNCAIRFDDINKNGISFQECNESITSSLYPDHLCTPQYLRSSYNAGGYNNICTLYRAMDLYDIFDPIFIDDVSTDCSKDKLELCLENAKRNQEIWHSLDIDQYSIYQLPSFEKQNINCLLTNKDIIEKINNSKDLYNNGIVKFDQPIEVYGYINNYCPYESLSIFSSPALIIKESIEFYIQMSDIIVEFIEYALKMEDPYIVFWG